MLPPAPSLQLPQHQMASFGLQQNPSFGQPNQFNFGIQTQHSQQSFMPLSAPTPFQVNQQFKPTPQIQFQVSHLSAQPQISQPLFNYQQQPLVVQNLIQPQPQLQYQQQIVQPPPIQITQPAQIERKVNYVPQKKQIVKMEEQEIEEIVPVERTIVEYIPVQTIIEKIPVPVEIPYEVRIPRPYEQELYFPNDRNHFWTDQVGNPLQNPLQNPEDLNKQKQPEEGGATSYIMESNFNVNIPDADSDEEYDVLIEKYTRILEEIKQKKRRRRKQQGLDESDEDFDFSRFQSGYRRGYNSYDYDDDRYDTDMRTSSKNVQRAKGYVGRGRNARDYIR